MAATLDNLTAHLYNIIWAVPLTILALGTGLYFSLRMKFPQIRLLKDMVHFLLGKDRKREDRTSKEGMSSFQAFALALGGRVGVGNIAGVATAICDRLERTAQGKIITHASITAQSFFEKRGYRVMRKQQVFRRGIVLVNFVMEKDI